MSGRLDMRDRGSPSGGEKLVVQLPILLDHSLEGKKCLRAATILCAKSEAPVAVIQELHRNGGQ